MQRPDDFFQTFKDKDLFYHLSSNLFKYKIWYNKDAPHGYFEVLAPRPIASHVAEITIDSKGEAHITFAWYVDSDLRKKITDLVASCPETLHPQSSDPLESPFPRGTEAIPEDFPVSP